VALVRTDVSEGLGVSIKTTIVDELGALAVPSNRCKTLVIRMTEALSSSETSVPTRSTRRHIPEDAILHIHRYENLKSYIALTGWTL
jgi:hypothetical protein